MARGEPTIVVECDKCHEAVELGMTALARGGYDDRNIDGELKRMGWTVEGGEDICPDCNGTDDELDEE